LHLFRLDPGYFGNHVGNNGGIGKRISKDNGKTWSAPEVIYNDQYDNRFSTAYRLDNGDIIAFFIRRKIVEYQVVEKDGKKYVECLPDNQRMESERDALDLVAMCGENGTDKVIIHAECLNDDFYDLKTGLAGAILLKFVNYYIKVAAILPVEKVNQGKFREFALETNRGRDFRIFNEKESAEDWLLKS